MRHRRIRSAAGLVTIAVAAVALLPTSASAGSPAATSAAAPTTAQTVVSVTFGSATGPLRHPYVGGSAHDVIQAEVLTRNGGTATAVSGVTGSAMRLPAYQPLVYDRDNTSRSATPLAVLRLRDVAPPSGSDPLDPGDGTFAWGADFSVDNDTGDDLADGDNLFQRGLTPDTLWKLQADHHLVTCGLKTLSMNDALYTAGFSIPADEDESSVATRTVYRALCTRTTTAQGATLTATLKRRTSSGGWVAVGPPQVADGSAQGSVAMDWSIPLSVGGKLSDTGAAINEHPDEFNGIVDNVRLTFG